MENENIISQLVEQNKSLSEMLCNLMAEQQQIKLIALRLLEKYDETPVATATAFRDILAKKANKTTSNNLLNKVNSDFERENKRIARHMRKGY